MPRRWIVDNRRWSAALGVVLAVALGLAAFIVTRELAADGPTQAQPAEQPTPEPGTTATPAPGVEEPPGPDVTPEPGATPDTSKPYWGIPWDNADRLAPKHDIERAGIALGPGVTRDVPPCEGEYELARLTDALGSAVAISMERLPVEASARGISEAALCDGVAVAAWLEATIPPDPDAEVLVRSGEKSWFEVGHGAHFRVGRLVAGPAFENATIPTARWHEVIVAGHLVAAAGPTIADGYGPSAAYAYVDGVLTIVEAWDLTLAETLAILEAVIQ